MRNKLLSSVLFLLVSNIFAADIVAPDPKILTGDDLASTALWRGLHHNNDSLRKSMNDNIKAYAAAYIPEIYSKSNQNEVRLSQYTGDIINVIADQVNAVQDSNQIFIIEKEISVGEYNLNTGTFSATVPLVIYLPTN